MIAISSLIRAWGIAGLSLLLLAAPAEASFWDAPPEIRKCQSSSDAAGRMVFDESMATYRVRIISTENRDRPDDGRCTTLAIEKDGHPYVEDSYLGVVDGLPPKLWPDIVGNGVPGFAIARNTQTGAACCVHLEVFELGTQPKRLVMIPDEQAPAPWYSNVRLGASDGRGVPTVIVTDDIPLEACGAEVLFCAKADIILVWRAGAYRVAVEQMRHSPPKLALLSREADAMKRHSGSDESAADKAHLAIQRAIDLIFSGNESAGWRFLQDSCRQKGGCHGLIAELRRALDKDPYYRAIDPVAHEKAMSLQRK